jgi:cyanophycinase
MTRERILSTPGDERAADPLVVRRSFRAGALRTAAASGAVVFALAAAPFLGPAIPLGLPGTWAAAAQAFPALDRAAVDVRVGPPKGTLVVAGGGTLGPEIWARFVELAGGPDAVIVVIPTASAEDSFPDEWEILQALRGAGAERITLLHTRDRATADSDAFTAPLRKATGVWIPGGRQHRLAQAYLHTSVHAELVALLERGGVVGGTSAGASIQASFLVRGDPESNTVVVSAEFMEGFGFLEGAAVDQHLLARNREDDLWEVLRIRPDLLGIGLDEGTAIVVSRDRAEVIGRSQAIFYDATTPRRRTETLRSGGVFDLGRRERLVQ